MDFMLPAIDRKATKKAVEAALEKYRIFLLTLKLDQMPKVTQHYSLVPAKTNKLHSSTEEIAIRNADYEQYIQRIVEAVNRLDYWERAIIIQRYMNGEGVFDYAVYNELGMSHRHYYRLKSRAFYKLAFALEIEVYRKRRRDEQ
ncbi:ArpU family transcriptional regulator [Anoxybacillus ayderensis]|nr:ArpU family transcriptional regulator [Anoxybacillus ayderensis]